MEWFLLVRPLYKECFGTEKLINIGEVTLEINSLSLFMKVYIISRLHNRQYSMYVDWFVTTLNSGIILQILFVDYKNWLNVIF